MANMILSLPAVKVRTGLSRSAIYLQISEGTFPKQISLGAKAIGWLESDVENWVCQKVELSRSEP
jgi:prophage regulatory protein